MSQVNSDELNYFDHLEILRWKIIKVLGIFVVLTALFLLFSEKLVVFLQEPVRDVNVNLYYFKPYEKFMTYIKVSFYCAVIFTIPYTVYQIADFVYPALKKEERKYSNIILLSIPILFFLGAFLTYKLAAPMAMKFFIGFSAGDNIKPMWSFADYLDMLLGFMIVSGLLFQLPVVILALIKIGLVKIETFEYFRRHIIVIIAVIAGIFSPPDVISQLLIGVPLYLLFEISILVGKIFFRKR